MACKPTYKGKRYNSLEELYKANQTNAQQEQAKKFTELQERLNNKEFLEGAKSAYESTPKLKQFGTQEEYNDYIARVSLGIIKNPSSGEYNYDSKVKDIVYHGTGTKIEQFEIRKEPLIHFGTKNAALHRGSILNQVLLNIEDLQTIKDGMWFLGTDEGGLLKELLDRNVLTIEEVRSINSVKNEAIQNSYSDHFGARRLEGEKAGNRKLQEILKDKNIGFEYINFSEDKGSTSYAVPSQEQIHILGSQADIQGFKEFVNEKLNATIAEKLNIDNTMPIFENPNEFSDEFMNHC